MVGPVLYQELLLAGRRSQQHIFRWIYAGWLIVLVMGYSWLWLFGPPERNSYVTGDLASWFTEWYVLQQLILMVLITPALAAGSVTEEKANGTLQYLLTSDLTSAQIVLGKLLARSFLIGVLALAGLPLYCFLAAFAGAEPFTMIAVVGVTVAPLVGLVSASLLASVWCFQTRNAALGLYGVGMIGILLVWWLGDVLSRLDPLYVLEPAWGARDLESIRVLGQRLVISLAAWGLVTAVCTLLAVWRLRPAYRRQLEGEGKSKKRWQWWRAERVAVDDEPIRWKERHVEGLAPAATLRRSPRWLGMLTVFAITTASSTLILWYHLSAGATLDALFGAVLKLDGNRLAGLLSSTADAFYWQGIAIMLLGSLVVGIRCSGAISGERERLTWEALLLTPLSAKQLIRGKLWGIMGTTVVYLLACAVPAVVLSAVGSAPDLAQQDVPAVVWTVIWLATTVLAMYFIGAVGLWCSVRCKTSWRSMLWTVCVGYLGGLLIYCVTALPIMILALIVILALVIISNLLELQLFPTTASGFSQFFTVFQILMCVGLAVAAWLASRLLLSSAQKYVAFRERTLQWQEEPPPRYRRRAPRRVY